MGTMTIERSTLAFLYLYIILPFLFSSFSFYIDIMEMVNADDLKQVALRILARLMEISMSTY